VSSGALLGGQRWTAVEEEEFAEMARYRDEKGGMFERFARSVAPGIYGNDGKFQTSLISYTRTYTNNHRYQKVGGVSLDGRLKKDATRRHALEGRHKRAPSRRSRNSKKSTAQVC
jgi:hypothetical protein